MPIGVFLFYLLTSNDISSKMAAPTDSKQVPSTDFVHEMIIGSGKLSHDGKITRFDSPIVKFSVSRVKQLTTNDIQLLDQSCSSIKDGQLHIHCKSFHVVISIQSKDEASRANNHVNNSYSKQGKSKLVTELRLYDDINNHGIYHNESWKYGNSLYCARRINKSYDSYISYESYGDRDGKPYLVEEYIRTVPRRSVTDYSNYETINSWYSLAVSERNKRLKQLAHEDDVRNAFGLTNSQSVNLASDKTAPTAAVTTATSNRSNQSSHKVNETATRNSSYTTSNNSWLFTVPFTGFNSTTLDTSTTADSQVLPDPFSNFTSANWPTPQPSAPPSYEDSIQP